jgi:hypothetical protein
MTRTDVVASVRPQAQEAASMKRRSPRALRRLSVLPIALLVAVALAVPTTALAASTGTTGYNQTPPAPASGTSPSKEASTPKKETAPAKATSTPTTTTTTTTPKSGTLPFTGFDLRWTVGLGLLLMGAGFSIVTVQRRQRRDS